MGILAFAGAVTLCAACQQGSSATDGESVVGKTADDTHDAPNESGEKSVKLDDGTDLDSLHIDATFFMLPNAEANQHIMERINEVLGGTYEGELTQVEAMMQHYASAMKNEMQEIRNEIGAEMGFERDLKIEKLWENDNLITYQVMTYEFSGGAHGGTNVEGLTFRKSDGRQLGYNVLNRRCGDEEWNRYMKEGLMQYFEAKTEEELLEYLFCENIYEITLPKSEPYFLKDGLTFNYQQYEIAPYAAGMPSFTIPYDKLTPYLNITGRKVL